MFKWCKRCVGMRQFLGDYEAGTRRCDVCGDEG